MKSGIQFEQGEIILVNFPFTDLSSSKQRPALILSNSNYNNFVEDVVVCGITSNLDNEEYSVIINNNSMECGNIYFTSRVKVDKIFTLNKSIIKKKIGIIKKTVLAQVKKEVFKLFSC